MNPIEKLKQIRKQQNLSQVNFAQKYGLKDKAMKYIENGKQAIPDQLALALEREYNINFRWWKTGTGPMEIEEPATPEERSEAQKIADDWQAKLDLTDKEMRAMFDAMHADKTVCILLFHAINGDTVAMERLKKLIC